MIWCDDSVAVTAFATQKTVERKRDREREKISNWTSRCLDGECKIIISLHWICFANATRKSVHFLGFEIKLLGSKLPIGLANVGASMVVNERK